MTRFFFFDTLTEKEISDLKANALQYLEQQDDFQGDTEKYFGKLIYIKASLPFSKKGDI